MKILVQPLEGLTRVEREKERKPAYLSAEQQHDTATPRGRSEGWSRRREGEARAWDLEGGRVLEY